MTSPPAALVEALHDRYVIERTLGRGGMATVYLARDVRHDRYVALKVLHAELGRSLGPERFLREIRLAASLQHTHILPVHESGETAGRLWFTMPYVAGESLRDRLRRERQLPVDAAVRIASQVARALDHAHRHGVIHRDIKPENILLTEDGDTLVADFGIGRATGVLGEDDRITETGVVVGTPAYMSPEQGSGERELDGRSDLYSLGCVLYEMLAGEPPFTGPTAQAMIARRLTETARPLHLVRETVSPELEHAVDRSLARAPADRFAIGAEMAEALSAASHAGAAHSTTHVPSPVGSRRAPILVGLALLAAAAVAFGLLRSRAGSRPILADTLIAVAPFDVLDPKLALWREGLVDLLSRNLDGAGPLRTVAPTTVIRRWTGRADPESAGDLGRRTGAGLALYGSLLGAGPDSMRLRATLYDVAAARPIQEWELTDVADRVDRAADSLTIRVLEGLGRTRPIGAVRLVGFGSTSLPALKAFLQGEQLLRRSAWDSALVYYQRAIELDSTFAPAFRRASLALGWIRTGTDSLSTTYAQRAGELNHGLPTRDSLYIATDSVMASLLHAGTLGSGADSGYGPRLDRLFQMAEYGVARYPDDAEAWHLLGEAEEHLGPMAGRPADGVSRAFDRAIALDSSFGPSYIHAIELAAIEGPEPRRRYMRPYLALAAGNDRAADGARLLELLVDSATPPARRTALYRRTSDEGLFTCYSTLSRMPDGGEQALDLARYITAHPLSIPPLDTPERVRGVVPRQSMVRGRLRAGAAVFWPRDSLLVAEAALLGAIPAESASAHLSERAHSRPTFIDVAWLPWLASRHDTVALTVMERRAAEAARRTPASASLPTPDYVARSAHAFLALARRDTTTTIEQLLALPRSGCPACYLNQLTLAELLIERHRDQEAWTIVRANSPTAAAGAFPSEVLWTLLRGRVAERIGERDTAIRSYAWVAGMWRDADPSLQPYVVEAREGMARLTKEPS